MFRNLKAIEIAEGALLADVAVIFQLLALYLPLGELPFLPLIFVIFTILVLRRGLYVSFIAFSVAIFILLVVTGFHDLSLFLLSGSGGLFLGLTMRWRLPHSLLILLGALLGALALFALLAFFNILAGQSLNFLKQSVLAGYEQLMNVADFLMARVGVMTWWKQNVYPAINAFSTTLFRYWWLTGYFLLCITLIPVVTIIYAITNLFVRLLGYEVRAFPGGRFGRWQHRAMRRLLIRIRKSRAARKVGVKHI